MDKLVSVIVPVYNTEKYIKRCIDSILGQTYTNLELILINDGSSQNEEEIILGYAAKDSRVRYVKNEENIGQYLTRLKGVRLSKGDYIAFVDSDDYINVDFIRLLVNKAVEEQADMVFSTTVIEKTSGEKVINIYHDIELKKLPLEKESLAEAFYTTEGKVYVWYTIWNKLYKKDLWMRAIPYLERLDKNLRMIEDMACVAILVCLDAKAVVAENSVYYYCQREDSATSRNSIDIDYYKYCINSIITVFQFIKDFLSANGTAYLDKFDKFVAYYGSIWRRSILLLNESEYEEAEKEVEKLCRDIGSVSEHIFNSEDTYFNGTQIEYDDSLDKIKEKIIKSTVGYISFDIFDTAVLRPFDVPSDIFYLLDKIYEENADSTVSFHDMRIDAEIACRQSLCTSLTEDISLEDIYNYLYTVYGVSKSLCSMLKKEEESLELKFAQRRGTVYEIYELALLMGKKVVFTSDMYLDKEIIKKILLKCGYNNFDNIYISSELGKRKGTGNLYKVLMDKSGIACDDIIHIGDNKSADIEGAEKCGIQAIYIPRTVDVFKQKVNNAEKKCSGYGCMIAMAANKYFDNPYRYFHSMTTYNMDPYLMGYYALGMNLVAQLQWIESNRDNIGKIIFTSRDGYLMYRAFDIYNKYASTKGDAIYKYISRRAILPIMLSSKADFMKFPMQITNLTPNEVCKILSFCSGEIKKNELSERYNIQWDKIFADRAEYHRFMDIYYEHIYNIQAHKESIELVREYLSDIDNQDVIYDMGYTATMHYAVTKATNKTPKALYIHTDMDIHQSMSRKGDFCIDMLMPNIPSVSSILREYIYSSTEGSCVGYARVENKPDYMLENVEHTYSDVWPLHIMQEAALSFVEEFYEKFAGYERFLVMRRSDIIEPFEDLLQVKTRMDTKVFNLSYFDDVDSGTSQRLNVRDYWLQVLLTLPGGENDIFGNIKDFLEEKNKKGLAYWGTGKICEDILRAHNIKVDVFYDNNPAKAGMRWHNGVINNPTNVSELRDYYIVIACAAYAEVEMQLQRLGLDKYKDYVSYIDMF